jgi:hypothetical protein
LSLTAFPLPSDSIARFTLPVGGATVTLGHPTGLEDLLLVECSGDDAAAALALAQRLAHATNGSEIVWTELAATDLDVMILRLRQALLGDRVASELHCHGDDCGSRIEISFSIEAYIEHHRPRPPPVRGRVWRVLACTDEPGWFHLSIHALQSAAVSVRFRLPTVSDQIYAAGQRDPETTLARVCIRPEHIAGPLRRRIETAMHALGPSLVGELQGQCPDCGTLVAARFDPRHYCLQELRDRARFIYGDVDVLARRYHWAEQSILAMPNARRANYVELALAGGSA